MCKLYEPQGLEKIPKINKRRALIKFAHNLSNFSCPTVIFFSKFSMPYVYSRPYVYSFCQIFQALRLFPALRLLGTLEYSEVPNRRACSLRFFRFSFHSARLLIYLVNKQAGQHFFPSLLVYSGLLVYQGLQSMSIRDSRVLNKPACPITYFFKYFHPACCFSQNK